VLNEDVQVGENPNKERDGIDVVLKKNIRPTGGKGKRPPRLTRPSEAEQNRRRSEKEKPSVARQGRLAAALSAPFGGHAIA